MSNPDIPPGPYLFFRNGTSDQVAQLYKALNYISQTPEGAFLRDQLNTNFLNVEFTKGKSGYDVANRILYWDPEMGNGIIQADGKPGVNSPAVVLAHEMYHWYWDMRGDSDFEESVATAYEGRIAVQLGEPVRPFYGSIYYNNPAPTVYDVTASAKGGYWKAVKNGVIETGPEYDPNVKVITDLPPTQNPPGDNDAGGGGDGGGGSGGGGSVGGGGGGGTWIGNPSHPDPEQPTHPGFVAPSPNGHIEVEIVGIPELAPHF